MQRTCRRSREIVLYVTGGDGDCARGKRVLRTKCRALRENNGERNVINDRVRRDRDFCARV